MEVTISLPAKQFIADTPEQVAAKIRLYAALGMYQTGELSIGAACEVAGVDRYVFLELIKREGIALKTQTPDELEAEFRQMPPGL
jgi:predicted HTH domain antitoxin